MKGKRITLFVITLLLLVGLTSGYIANTYAKYTSDIPGKAGTVTVAKWKFKSENESKELTIKLDDTPHTSTLSSGKIAPGTSGSFNLALTNENTETGVKFTVKIKDKSNVPANLKFYTDDTYTTELTGDNTITGKLKAKDPTGVSIPIYWKWEYESGNDAQDTTDGESDKNWTITVDITGVQVAPGVEISSSVN